MYILDISGINQKIKYEDCIYHIQKYTLRKDDQKQTYIFGKS